MLLKYAILDTLVIIIGRQFFRVGEMVLCKEHFGLVAMQELSPSPPGLDYADRIILRRPARRVQIINI